MIITDTQIENMYAISCDANKKGSIFVSYERRKFQATRLMAAFTEKRKNKFTSFSKKFTSFCFVILLVWFTVTQAYSPVVFLS